MAWKMNIDLRYMLFNNFIGHSCHINRAGSFGNITSVLKNSVIYHPTPNVLKNGGYSNHSRNWSMRAGPASWRKQKIEFHQNVGIWKDYRPDILPVSKLKVGSFKR